MIREITVLSYYCFYLDVSCIDSDGIVEEIDDGHSSTGSILRKQDGRTETSSSGSKIFFIRSTNRPHASAVKTYQDTYVGGDRTPRVYPVNNQNQNFDHDLHTAYRLPLQRLSDRQLSALLSRYTPQEHEHMSRVDMINKVQEMILQRSNRRLIRPTLLTSIKMHSEDVTIDSEPAADPKNHERTTLSSVRLTTPVPVLLRKPDIRRSQKQIPEIEVPRHVPTTVYNKNNRLRDLNHTLRQVKARYNAAKVEYLRRLRELNERKITLAVPQYHQQHVQTTNVIHTSESKFPVRPLAIVDNEPESQEIRQETKTESSSSSSTTTSSSSFSMVEGLKKLISMVKNKQSETKVATLHDGGSQDEVEVVAPKKSGPPRASPIPKAYAVKAVPIEEETKKDGEIETVVSHLHSGGDDEVEDITSTSTKTEEEKHEESHVSKTFKFNMKKVSDISTSDLLNQLKKEVDSTTVSSHLVDNEEEEVEVTTTPESVTEEVTVEETTFGTTEENTDIKQTEAVTSPSIVIPEEREVVDAESEISSKNNQGKVEVAAASITDELKEETETTTEEPISTTTE